MLSIKQSFVMDVALAVAGIQACFTSAYAHPHAAGEFPDASKAAPLQGVHIEQCWIRAMPVGLPSAGYFVLHNSGAAPISLMGAEAEGFDKTMLHASETKGGMSAMVHVDHVDIAPGERMEFAPGGHHIMLEQPTAPVKIGSQQPITLWFDGDR